MPPRSYLILTIPEHPLRYALDMPFPSHSNLLTELNKGRRLQNTVRGASLWLWVILQSDD